MTAIHNTLTGTTTIRQLPTIAGQPHPLPEHYIVLEVINNPAPDYNPATHRLTSEYIVNLEGLQYVRIWTEVAYTPYEIAIRDWTYPEYEFRIVCPKQLGEQYPAMYVHFKMEELPIEKHPNDDNLRRIYINTILPQHSNLIEQLQEVVDVEPRPELLNDNIL